MSKRIPGTYRSLLRGGNFLAVLPEIPDDASENVKNALAIRNAATLSGRCACGAVAGPIEQVETGIYMVTMEHENDCPAADENLARALERADGKQP